MWPSTGSCNLGFSTVSELNPNPWDGCKMDLESIRSFSAGPEEPSIGRSDLLDVSYMAIFGPTLPARLENFFPRPRLKQLTAASCPALAIC